MITLLRAHETTADHTIRAWTGPATDEGVGLISMIEVSDPTGRPVCRFEVFLASATQNISPMWPRGDNEAARQLQDHAVEQARDAILRGTVAELHGHRYDVT